MLLGVGKEVGKEVGRRVEERKFVMAPYTATTLAKLKGTKTAVFDRRSKKLLPKIQICTCREVVST